MSHDDNFEDMGDIGDEAGASAALDADDMGSGTSEPSSGSCSPALPNRPKYRTTPFQNGKLMEEFAPHLRPTDVLITTAAKSGQTWMQVLLLCIVTRGKIDRMKELFHWSPWLELPVKSREDLKEPLPNAKRIAFFNRIPNPRIFKLHLPYSQLIRHPDPEIDQQIKCVVVTRDLRDIPYSMFRHLRNMDPEYLKKRGTKRIQSDFGVYFERNWMKKGKHFTFLKEIWGRRNDPKFVFVRFEDLKTDLLAESKRICADLGWKTPTDEEFTTLILPKCDIRWMKKHQKTHITGPVVFKGDFIRQGKIGKNRKKLTPQMMEALLKKMNEELEPECVKYMLRDEFEEEASDDEEIYDLE